MFITCYWKDNFKICRPAKLTERWVKEFSTAINRQCGAGLYELTSTNEVDFEKYINEVLVKCKGNRVVKDILSYDLDYNEKIDK
jgi:hypothetical protein